MKTENVRYILSLGFFQISIASLERVTFPWQKVLNMGYAKPVEFTLGAQTWLLDDQHCVRANCSCQEAALSFFELRPSAQHSGVGIEPTLCIRYAYDTGQIE